MHIVLQHPLATATLHPSLLHPLHTQTQTLAAWAGGTCARFPDLCDNLSFMMLFRPNLPADENYFSLFFSFVVLLYKVDQALEDHIPFHRSRPTAV